MNVTWKFLGNAEHTPMWWQVDPAPDGGAYVMESYDNGITWICNCKLASEQDAWDFISLWFAQFYE